MCVTCPGPAETNHHGRTHVSRDADAKGNTDTGGLRGQTYGDVQAATNRAGDDPAGAAPDVSDLIDLAEAPAPVDDDAAGRMADRLAMAECLRHILNMDERTLRIVRWRFANPDKPLAILAKRYRVSTQSVHQRLQQVARTWPNVRFLLGLRLRRN